MNLQNLNHFDLRQIYHFMAVVQAGNNFSEAANRLGLKQPNLSQSIQTLEKQLGHCFPRPSAQSVNSQVLNRPMAEVKLFDRSKRPIELTEAGQVFLKEIEMALGHFDRAIAQAQQASQGQIGRLKVGLNNAIANSILPEVLKVFQQRFPNVEVELREVTIQQEIQMLKNRELDVVFQRSPSFDQTDGDLRFETILDEYFVVALPRSHKLAQQTYIPLTALEHEPLILPSLDVLPFYEEVLTRCRTVGFEPKILSSITVTGVVALLSLVASEKGVAILPNHVQTLHREGVVYRTIRDAALTRQIAMVWRQKDTAITLFNFLNVIQETMQLPLLDSW
ncbi:MAG: LysR substrate-binding domain-containing protein [Oculatellaceae cyanobacterium Prado106]|jgi:DNA-binding transcriptional LysR family regulator|nr:LysR substrate-binding domain-containing protein [Oculatellaceae cyanobacterium Prado106]